LLKLKNTPNELQLVETNAVKRFKTKFMEESKTINGKMIFWIIVALLLAIVPWFF